MDGPKTAKCSIFIAVMKKSEILENKLSDHDACTDGFERQFNNKPHSTQLHKKQEDIPVINKKIQDSSTTNNWEKFSEKDNPALHTCSICKIQFSVKHKLRNHERMAHSMHLFTCIFCKEGFQLKNQLMSHVLLHKGTHGYKCEICYKVRTSYIMILRHLKTHAEKNVVCMICGARFKTRWELKSHEIQHKRERHFKCQLCSSCFMNPTQLRCHRLTHFWGNSHRCDICGKNFNAPGYLMNHKKLHLSEKPFKCQYCSLSFQTSSIRKKHTTVHETERRKPFRCDDCGKEYTSTTSLAVHRIKLHSESETYQCRYCKYKFRTKASIIEHSNEHAAERPHSCKQCLRRYKTKRELNRHQREKNHFGRNSTIKAMSPMQNESNNKLDLECDVRGNREEPAAKFKPEVCIYEPNKNVETHNVSEDYPCEEKPPLS